jgi:hypothetical protein
LALCEAGDSISLTQHFQKHQTHIDTLRCQEVTALDLSFPAIFPFGNHNQWNIIFS